MKILRTASIALASMAAITALAVPAKRGVRTITQPDGSTLQVIVVGDEFNHMYMTPDSLLLATDAEDFFTYATVGADGILKPSSTRATDNSRPARAVSYRDFNLSQMSMAREAANTRSRAIPQTGMGRFAGNFPRTGKIKGLVILVQYSDLKFTLSDPKSYFTNMLNKEGFNEYNGTGSARDFFLENSGGKFDPDFDVYGPYTLPNKRSYYGGNDSYGNDQHPEDMVIHGCQGLDNVINFADYDMDNDGYVDNVFVFYAGQGEASYGPKESVWPHQWNLGSAYKSLVLDGKRIDKYACSNEYERNRPDGVGTFVHEFSHVMGLPDLYATDYNHSDTPGEWSTLDQGPYNNNGCTPPYYSAYERNAMGWCEPIVLQTGDEVSLEHIASSNNCYIVQTPRNNEFFLIENRQKNGWDRYVPGKGMLVWHIDYNESVFNSNTVNNRASHCYVRIIKANNSVASPAGWAFPGTSKVTSFTYDSSPSFQTWAGVDLELPIVNIKETNGIITFNVASVMKAPSVATPTPDEIYSDGFLASWDAVPGATDYLVSVYKASAGVLQEDVYDGSSLPAGWSKTSTKAYSTGGNFGQAAPSLRLDEDGQTLTTRTYSSPVTKLKFWHKGMSSSGNTALTIEGKVNGAWVELHKFAPNTSGSTDDYTQYVAGKNATQLRFTFTKDKGNLAIDDVEVSAGGSSSPVEGLMNVSTGGATQLRVKVPAGEGTQFAFEVKATNGTETSLASELMLVNLADASGIDAIDADDNAPVEYYNMQGIRVENPTRGLYIRRQGTKATKVML